MSKAVEVGRPERLKVEQVERLISPEGMRQFAEELFGGVEHAKRVQSLAMGALGVVHAASLIVHAVGRGLASVLDLDPKHATKQVDRLIGNSKLTMERLFACWVKYVVGERDDLAIAMDWTEFAKDSQATIALYLISNHGRATPLLWRTVAKKTLTNKRNQYEDEVLSQLRRCLPEGKKVTILADRGFGDQLRYMYIDELGWDYLIRFRQGILVGHDGSTKTAAQWLSSAGRAKMLKSVTITADKTAIPAVVLAHNKAMKEPWCLASSRDDLNAAESVALYARRFTIEETFRDQKDIHFGMALSATHIKSAARRDRLLMLAAMAYAMLVLLGAAGEKAGLDKALKVNTVKRRTLSLYNQGKYWYSALPRMRDEKKNLLLDAYEQVLSDHKSIQEMFGIL